MASNNQITGLFIPTTNIYEIQKIQNSKEIDQEDLINVLIHLYQDMCNVAISLNLKDTGYYFTQEFMNGQKFFPNPNVTNPNYAGRQAFRTVINFGPLPNTSTTAVLHNIDTNGFMSFTRIYAVASDPINLNYIPIPYSSVSSVANNIEISVDSENVYITTGSDQSTFTTTYVILEYLKQ